MLKALRRYSADESEKNMEGEDMNNILLLSEEKQLNESKSSIGTVSRLYFMIQITWIHIMVKDEMMLEL